MGHHIKSNGAFQSDKHPWLPEDTILINPYRPQSEQAMLRWSDAGDWCVQLPGGGHVVRENSGAGKTYPKTRIIVFFDDERNIPMLEEVARAYEDADNELSEDIRARLLVLHPHKF